MQFHVIDPAAEDTVGMELLGSGAEVSATIQATYDPSMAVHFTFLRR